jgi:RND family efflux transporter MFP subunit
MTASTGAPLEYTAVGSVVSDQRVEVASRLSGYIRDILVQEGDRVRRGDLLLHLDRSLEELELKRRQVMLEDQSRLDELRRREVTLGQQVVHARSLFESGGLSRKQAEDEELAWQSNVAERKTLEFGKLREKIEVDLARENHERRHLRSPIDGVVTRVMLRVGESAVPNEPVLTVVDVSRVRFNGTFAAASMSPLRPGQTVSLRLGMGAGAVLRQAKVIFVSPVTDSASGLVELIAEFDNRDGSVRPGISGQIVAPSVSPERRSAAAGR